MRDNIVAGTVVAAMVGICGLGIYGAAKAERELSDYKTQKIVSNNIPNQIVKASVNNSNFTDVSSKYEAKKVLEYFQDQAMKATSKTDFEVKFSKLSRMIQGFQSNDNTRSTIALYEAKDAMEAEINEKKRREEEAARREMMYAQAKNTEAIVKAFTGESACTK